MAAKVTPARRYPHRLRAVLVAHHVPDVPGSLVGSGHLGQNFFHAVSTCDALRKSMRISLTACFHFSDISPDTDAIWPIQCLPFCGNQTKKRRVCMVRAPSTMAWRIRTPGFSGAQIYL